MMPTSIYPEKIQAKMFLALSVFVVVTLPLAVKLNSMAIILLTANWLLEDDWRGKWNRLKINVPALLLITLYVYHIVALLYTSNYRQGNFELEKKIAFLAFPLIYGTSRFLTSKAVTKILFWFIGSCLFAAVFCLVNATYYYLQGDPSYFFYHKLSLESPLELHAVYFSLYIAICVFILLYYLKLNWSELSTARKLSISFLISFFIIFIILLSSKTIIFFFFLVMIAIVGREILKRKGILWSSVSLLGGIIFFILVVVFVPNVRERFDEVLFDKYEQTNVLLLDDYAQYHFTGANVRLAIWKILVGEVGR